MAIRTYQKRAPSAQSKPTTVGNQNATLPPPPSSSFLYSNQEGIEKTPPWRRRMLKNRIDYMEDDDEFGNDDDENDNANILASNAHREFLRGKQEDRRELEKWVEEWTRQGKGDEKKVARCVPVEWPLDRQMRFAAWVQLLGLNCRWEGGYLWVETNVVMIPKLGNLFLRSMTKENQSSPLPAAPSTDVLAARMSALRLDDVQEDLDDGDQTWTARNRPRKWQHQQQETRRSSLGMRLSLHPRASLLISESTRRSSALGVVQEPPRRQTTRQTEQTIRNRKVKWNDVETAANGLHAMKQILGYISVKELMTLTCFVSKRWNIATLASFNLACASNLPPLVFLSSDKFFASYPPAQFLAEGAYKSVYKVSTKTGDLAVSVMNCDKIAELGDVAIVEQEVMVSLLLSELISSKTCPNFVETKRVFRLRENRWSTSEKHGNFQYIQMELCELGDLESHMKTLKGGVLPLEESRACVFQMVYSLYASRRALKLRHYDVKLLNFFATAKQNHEMRYMLGGHDGAHVSIGKGMMIVKLADYGTSDIDPSTLGKPIDVRHFTTLENTPPELLLFSNSIQSYACDTFQLGLSILHVLTGGLPYEEILVQVKCPVALMDAVSDVWESPGKEFEVLRCVLRDDDDNVLYHTLYRYLVLFGLPSGATKKNQFDPSNSKVFKAVNQVLSESNNSTLEGKSLKAKNIRQARKQFASDQAKFSLAKGTHHLITRARERGTALNMWDDLLVPCVQFDPEERISMTAALRSKAFSELTSIMSLRSEEECYGAQLVEMDEEVEATF